MMRRTWWVQVGASTPKAEAGGSKMRGPNAPRLWKNNMRFSMETSSRPSCGFSHNPLHKLPSWLNDVSPPPHPPIRSDAPQLSLLPPGQTSVALWSFSCFNGAFVFPGKKSVLFVSSKKLEYRRIVCEKRPRFAAKHAAECVSHIQPTVYKF